MVSLIAVNINGERPNFFFQGWSSLANHSSLNKGPLTPRSQGQEYGKHILIPIVVFLMFTGKKNKYSTHIRSHETHSGADVLFSNSAHFSAHHNFEFNLHLTSTNIFLTALYPGDQGHSVCFLAPSALKPSLLCSVRLKVSSVLFK